MKRRRVLLGVGIVLLVLVGVVVAGVIALPGIIRWVAVSQLGKTTGRPVTLDAVEASLYHGRLALRGLRVMDRDGAPLAALERAEVRFVPRALLRGHLHVTDVTVHGPAVRVVRTGPDVFNVSDLLARRAEKAGDAPSMTIDRLEVLGGSVVVEDRTLTPARTWRMEPVELRARDASTVAGLPPGQVTLTAVVVGAPIVLSLTDVRLAPPRFKAALTVRGVDASLASLYLPPASPLSPTRGTLDVSAAIEHDGAAGSHVAFDAGFTGVELRRPGQESAYLTAPAVNVTVQDLRHRPGGVVELGRLAVDGGSIVLEDTRLKPVKRWSVDGVALEARNLSSAREAPPGVATARATTSGARLEVWIANVRLAPVELNATAIIRNVDLGLARLYLPPELPVRPQRGVVNATLRVDHDARQGTRLGLDAGLSNIQVDRPAHVVTAPSMRVTVEGVTLDGPAVAVNRVTVASDRLTLEERTARSVRTWPVQNLAIEAKDLSSRREATQGVASLRASVGNATAAVFVTGARLEPLELRATAILRNFDAALLRHYVPDAVPVELGRGVVNGTLEVGHTAEATRIVGDATLTGLEAQGRDAFATLAVTSPSVRLAIADARRQGEALHVGRIELTGSGSLSDSRGKAARFDFSRVHVATEGLTWPVTAPARIETSMRFQDRGELDGSGTVRLTAPLPTIAWAAEMALKFRGVDLTPLAVYVPAAEGFGGRVRADVTASLAYAGALTAHLRGDVGGARFALVEGGQTLLGLRSISATGLDLKWPERMTIKRLRLREPQGHIVRDRQGNYPLVARLAASTPGSRASETPGSRGSETPGSRASETPGSRGSETPGPAAAGASPAPGAARSLLSVAIDEVVVENGSATVVDESVTPHVRVDLPRLGLTMRNVTWPATAAPVTLALEGTFLSGGFVKAEGTATAEPVGVDLTITCQDADLAVLQPYMGFRARVAGRLNANLTVSGPLAPVPRVKVKGDAGLRSLDISDGQRSVLTADRLRVTGIDADWPERIAADRIRVRRSWAQIERDAQGGFLLRNLLERPESLRPGRPAAAAAPAPAAPRLTFSFREGIFEEQAATIVDGVMSPPVRIEVAGARLAVHDFSFPQQGVTKVELKSPMPGGGTLDVAGTVQLEPMRVETRALLDGVAIDPIQQYLPIEGRVAGKVTGDLMVKLALEPMSAQVTGQARLRAFRLNDGERAVVTVGRLETSGIDVDWPRRIALQRVLLRRPRLLIERDQAGEMRLRRLVTPHWSAAPASAPSGASPAPAPPPAASPAPRPTTAAAGALPAAVPTIDVTVFSLEKAMARFVDYSTEPDYAEELEEVDVTVSPLSTAPGRRTRFSAAGVIGGGPFKLEGEGAYGDRPTLDMKLEIRNFSVPRGNPYLVRYTAWKAESGTLDVTGTYKLNGTELTTQHDVMARGLAVAAVDERDEVERRVGLPFGMLVSLLKDSRGEIKLSLPVSGDLAKREFDYQEAMWASVRNLAIRVIALPFSKIGSLFFSEDSKLKRVTLGPVVFEPGTDRFGPGMDPHLERVAEFFRSSPAVKTVLEPVLIEADVQALKRAQVLSHLGDPSASDALERARREHQARWPNRPMPATLDAIVTELAKAEPLPPEAMRTLATRRLEAVRQSLTRGGIDATRLQGTARRTPLVEAAGNPRVEFDLRS
jgi:hypothetical protein